MKDFDNKIQTFFLHFDNANGKDELQKISDEMDAFIDSLEDEKLKEKAKQSFKFYFNKRVANIEQAVEALKQNYSQTITSIL